MKDSLKRTPLNQWHREAGANMADFGGYDMPLWYETGVKTEHLAVLKSAGIFDTSHMACITLEGDGAFELLNFCFTRNIDSLKPGRCVYGAFLDDNGHCIDDAIVYKFSWDRFMVCVNAGMGGPVAAHLESWRQAREQNRDQNRKEDRKQNRKINIVDLSGSLAKLDIQGKNALRILSPLLQNPETVFDALPYFSFKGDIQWENSGVRLSDGTPVLLSRSGYTGEFGFEIFVQPEKVVTLWETLLKEGAPFNLTPCGLGARDSLRAGACLPLSHQDIGHFPFIHHPWDFALPYTEDRSGFTKPFLGAEALLNPDTPVYTYAFAGYSLRKVNAGDKTEVLDEDGNTLGRVLTCATDMAVSRQEDTIISINTPGLSADTPIKGLACGFVMVNRPLSPGKRLILKEGKRAIDVSVVRDIRPDRTARLALTHFI